MPSRVTLSLRSSAYTCEIFGKSPLLNLGLMNLLLYETYFLSISWEIGSRSSCVSLMFVTDRRPVGSSVSGSKSLCDLT